MATLHTPKHHLCVIQCPYPHLKHIQPVIDTIRANHLTSCVEHILVPIHYAHKQFFILTIYPVKISTTIQKIDKGANNSIGTLI